MDSESRKLAAARQGIQPSSRRPILAPRARKRIRDLADTRPRPNRIDDQLASAAHAARPGSAYAARRVAQRRERALTAASIALARTAATRATCSRSSAE